jgi:predicted MPP superfamily phosphohydrolase
VPRAVRLTIALTFAVLLYGLLARYFLRRLQEALGGPSRGRDRVLAAVLAASPLILIFGRVFEGGMSNLVARSVGLLGSALTLAVLISVVLLWVLDGATWIVRRIAALRAPSGAATAEAPAKEDADGSAEIPRREALRRLAVGGVLGVGATASAYGVLLGRHAYEVNEIPMPIPGLPRSLDGLRLVQLSDVHVGTYVGDYELVRGLGLVRDARPDMIVMTGDLVDHDARYATRLGQFVRTLADLEPRFGLHAIPGNHDYYAGVDTVLAAARAAGANVLVNGHTSIGDAGGRFALLGVDDVWARRDGLGVGPDLDAALRDVPGEQAKILLCHNPVFFPEARGRVALQLSGHTHGGQVNLGFRPADLVLPYVHGEYVEEGSRLYVNRGFGTAGPPSRVDAPPEVTVVVLVAT